jgi:Uncharacterized protein conserved in bacteria
LIIYYGLNELDYYGKGKMGILNYFEQVGCIQSDPLNIVGTNMVIALNTRFKNLNSKIISELLYEDRQLMDGFDKEAAVYLTKHWNKFENVREELARQHKSWVERNGNKAVLKHVNSIKEEIMDRGPLSSKDIDLGRANRDRWGGASNSNMIFRYLWSKGKIGISYKKHNVPYYDIIENLIPLAIEQEKKVTKKEQDQWHLIRRLDALGLYWTRSGSGWLGVQFENKKEIRENIKKLLSNKLIEEIEIEGINYKFYLSNANYQKLLDSRKVKLKDKVSFIAPLDNFIWDRQLVNELFNFEYTWEVYVPEKKRKYGYYVLPILYKDKFIGRVEPSRDKKRTNKFEIEKIWYEEEKYNNNKINGLINKEISRLNKFFE